MMKTRDSKPLETRAIDFAGAIAVFVRGFAFTRSVTYPFEVHPFDGVWLLRDAPRRNDKNYRRDEWVAETRDLGRVHDLALRNARGRYFICAMRRSDEPDSPVRAEFKRLGYRLMTTEPFMVHDLDRIPKFRCPAKIERVRTIDLAERLARAAQQTQISPEHLSAGKSAPLRQYVALDGEDIVGWVRSIDVSVATTKRARATRSWVSNLYTIESRRRRGIGRALMARMLRDDRTHGSAQSVLTASHTGAMLYPLVGYKQIGELMLFVPKGNVSA